MGAVYDKSTRSNLCSIPSIPANAIINTHEPSGYGNSGIAPGNTQTNYVKLRVSTYSSSASRADYLKSSIYKPIWAIVFLDSYFSTFYSNNNFANSVLLL